MASSRPSSPASGPQSRQSRSRSATPTPATTRLSSNNPFAALDSSSEDDNEILRPRGKLASRMQVRGEEAEESESELDLDANSTRASPSREDKLTATSAASNDDMEGDDEDVIMPRPRKLTSRRERSSTPETRPRQQEPASSPGLFVSPSKPQSPAAHQSDADIASSPAVTKNHRFQAMLAQKREERLAREVEEARKKAARLEAVGYTNDDDDLLVEDDADERITDDEGGRKLTQEAAAARPPRKASKKALEEMNRETQRLTRGLQLAHEAKVKKKMTKASLFERFNFKPAGAATAPVEKPAAAAATSSSRAPSLASAGQSDAEMNEVGTPPSSPPTIGKEGEVEGAALSAAAGTTNLAAAADDDDDFPTLEEIVARKQLDKGKGKETAADLEEAPKPVPLRKRVILPANIVTLDSDSDDDLHIIPSPKSKIDAIFARIPLNQAKEPLPLQRLRRLAHLDDPDKRPAPPSRPGSKVKKQVQEPVMTAAELHASLLQRARRQAKLERDRNLEELRAKGVHVQTAEERARERRDVENIVAKARQEAEEIMQREREDAKAERRRKREAGEEDPLGWDDSEDDEEYQEVEDEAEIELSGSEDEEEERGAGPAGELVDDAAESAEESETEEAEGEAPAAESDEEMLPSSKQARRRPRKQVTILSDDEDDAEPPIVKATPRPKAHFAKSPSASHARSPSVPTSVLRSATKTFIPGLPVAGPAGLGLTQIFAGTMDDSQLGTFPGAGASPSQPRPTFDVTAFPDSNFSQTARLARDDADLLILDSQPAVRATQQAAPETQGVQLRFEQSQVHGFDTFLREDANGVSSTQMSELLEPTQDGGFQNFSPLRQRFVELPASTGDTVAIGRAGETQADEQNDSPLVRRTGKLRRRGEVTASPSRRRVAEEEVEKPEADEFGFGTMPTNNNAFAAMKEAALKERKRKEAEAFDKKKSRARGMVEEQAEESEDEYAGLGGADGEDSSDDDGHSVKEMIDDETKEDAGDERKLAAFYADRERAADEKQVDKLFHDLTTGQLRRKRNGNWDDLSDDDDGGERRRRMKRQQFAKMQRTLFADERISKVAENPRNQAFLRTIEDHGSDEEMDFLFAPEPAAAESQASQASASATVIPNSQPQAAAPRLPNPRRTNTGKKPSNLSEIRESLSTLLDEPYHGASVIPATDPASSDGEEDDPISKPTGLPSSSDKENLPRGPPPPPATTNSLLSTSSSGTSTSRTGAGGNHIGGGGAGSDSITKIKKPAGKRSGVSYLARETERQAAVAEKERRREERKVKGAEGRGRAVGGLFGGGKFE
ncbi:MRC1-like domain-containing protein [Staphylotrichum tortipilum]|uniref:MRC1-like domain-containing protein n=1 Tax=Staphylotrichum tortipilum TaxID=2831512 RepID=A0AAN6MHB1_9PEZI|nr:MRC1-like domain-containing protein [Staphylotrichum longicolle]